MKCYILASLIFISIVALAQHNVINVQNGDTLAFDSIRNKGFLDRISQTHWFNATYLGVPLIIGGLIEKHQDSKFSRLRNDFMPQFHSTLDNYTQFAPAAVMVALKAAGVKSRSSWGRMLLSDAFATALMSGTTQILKNGTNEMRPDGSNNHSFPSGHTATAFMTATMLSKEYGYLSPWVSVGAYSVATATGLMRMANNKHWLSDVMVGAGIGIISTEMGYWLADVIFKDKGLNMSDKQMQSPIYYHRNPSFLGLYLCFNLPLSKYDLDENNDFQTSTGTTLGMEGAWFVNPYIGFGGKASISNLQYIVNGKDAPNSTFDFYSMAVGPYFSLPLTTRWRIGSKLIAGEVFYPKTTIGDTEIGKKNGLTVGTGASLDYQMHSNLVGSLLLDYNLQSPATHNSGEYMHIMTLSARVSVSF
jgi:membrane-associated phospholipid phosphatase